jgi:hypothetical protein
VDPEKFDALVEQLRGIGRLESISVQQRDRTGEFRKLHAQRQSLQKYLAAVVKLRAANKAVSVDDALKLEQKAQDIEKELQGLGVQFGELLGKESLYHVSATLFEYQPGSRMDRGYSIPERFFQAAMWAGAWWLALAFTAGIAIAACLSLQTLFNRTPT